MIRLILLATLLLLSACEKDPLAETFSETSHTVGRF